VTAKDVPRLKLPPNLLPKKPRGNLDKADVITDKCRSDDWCGNPVLVRRRPGGTDSAEMSQG